jgi:hypothetical protein
LADAARTLSLDEANRRGANSLIAHLGIELRPTIIARLAVPKSAARPRGVGRTVLDSAMPYRIRTFRIPGWQLVLLGAVALALIAAFFVAAVGIFLVLVPLFVLAGALAYLFGLFRAPRGPRGRGQIIETEYRVVDQRRIEDEPAKRRK